MTRTLYKRRNCGRTNAVIEMRFFSWPAPMCPKHVYTWHQRCFFTVFLITSAKYLYLEKTPFLKIAKIPTFPTFPTTGKNCQNTLCCIPFTHTWSKMWHPQQNWWYFSICVTVSRNLTPTLSCILPYFAKFSSIMTPKRLKMGDIC